MNKLTEFIKQYRWTILLIGAGLLLAILLMTIGFWKTILLAVIIAVFGLFGYLMDRGGPEAVKSFFSALFKGNGK